MFQQKLPVVKIVLHTYAVSNGHVEYKEYTLFGKTTLPGCQMCQLARKKYFKVITNQKPTLCPMVSEHDAQLRRVLHVQGLQLPRRGLRPAGGLRYW